MPIETADDRAVFFDPDEFGVEALYTPNGGAAVAVSGIFDRSTVDVQLGDVAVLDRQPWFTCRDDDLPDGADDDVGDTLTVEGVAYKVAELRPDGSGVTRIRLTR